MAEPHIVIDAANVTLALGAGAARVDILRGIDLQVDYSQPLGFSLTGAAESNLNFFFLGTYTDRFEITPVAELPENIIICEDRFGLDCDEPRPRFKWTTRLSLIDGPVTTSVRWRHLSSVEDDDPGSEYSAERIGGYDLFDLSFSFDVTEKFSLALGVNNVFDTKPPILGDNQEQTNTYPLTYDVLGRDFFVSANVRF
jgi:outer membrane receptor protein involved in Fe transport